jgi:protein O-GlcNAc transferase
MPDMETAKRYFFEAVALLDAGDFAGGALRLREALKFAPDNISILTNLAGALMMGGNFAEARAAAERVLALDTRNLGAHLVVAECLTKEGRDAAAAAALDAIIALEPGVAEHHSNRSAALNRLKRHNDALASADRAIALKPTFAAAHLNRGNSLFELGRHDQALASYDRALGFSRSVEEAWVGRGNALAALKRHGEAVDAFDQVLRGNASAANAWLGRGNVLAKCKRFDEALAAFARALAADPALADAWLGRGNALKDLGLFGEALDAYDRALALGCDIGPAWTGRGNILLGLWRDEEALAAFDRALVAKATLAEAWFGRGAALDALKRYEEAIAAFDVALSLDPDTKFAGGSRLQAKALLCDWVGWDGECAAVVSAVSRGEPVAQPFNLIAVTASAAVQLQCARTFAADRFPPSALPLAPRTRNRHDRIHVAYLSADFRDHPVSALTAGLFECHDRSRFRTTAISSGPDSHDEMRNRIKAAFEHFVDVDNMTDADAAARMRDLGVDIAVDLTGFTRGFRTGILARRAAPIQVNYLGFPATMGADFIDYIIADRHVIPDELRSAYAESVVHLPDTFQANDRKRVGPERTPSRREAGLPETGLVLCTFNSLTKVSPAVFDVWMRLLRQTDGAVLWTLANTAATERNLRGAAASRGVAPDRLVFAPRVAYADYLARFQCADLFLDAWPFNGGTTTSDALWAGLPVVTCAGEAFAARMATSLLHAAGLPELATGSLAEYEQLALALAKDPGRLATIRAKLAANRSTCALFDTDRFRRHIEAAYTTMYERHRRGEPPASFAVAAIDHA